MTTRPETGRAGEDIPRAATDTASSVAPPAASTIPQSYGPGVRRSSLACLGLGALLVLVAGLGTSDTLRSVVLGAGLVALSSSATVLVAAQMYRVAPAATAPALAALYLLKVLVLGWVLLVVGAPGWLASRAFAVTVLACLVLSTAVFALLVRRVTAGMTPRSELALPDADGGANRPLGGLPGNRDATVGSHHLESETP